MVFKVIFSTQSWCNVSNNTNFVIIKLILTVQSDILTLTLEQACIICELRRGSWLLSGVLWPCWALKPLFANVSSFRNDQSTHYKHGHLLVLHSSTVIWCFNAKFCVELSGCSHARCAGHAGKRVSSCWRCHVTKKKFIFIKSSLK